MEMDRRRRACAALCLALGLGLLAGTPRRPSPAGEQRGAAFYQAGVRAGEKLRDGPSGATGPEADIYAAGRDFSIPRTYYDGTVGELMAGGRDRETAEELARQILFYKFSLYSAAEQAGCTVSDSHVEQVIAGTRAGIQQAANKSDFDSYLEGMGMSEEAYWDSQFENIKIYESISAYRDHMFQAFAAEAEGGRTGADEAAWEAEWERIVREAIDGQEIEILG